MSGWFIITMIAACSIGVLIGKWVFWPTLQERDEEHAHALELQHEEISTVRYFFRGFFVRLFFGSLVIPFIALLLLIRTYLRNDASGPEVVREALPSGALLIGSLFYLGICILGGFLNGNLAGL